MIERLLLGLERLLSSESGQIVASLVILAGVALLALLGLLALLALVWAWAPWSLLLLPAAALLVAVLTGPE